MVDDSKRRIPITVVLWALAALAVVLGVSALVIDLRRLTENRGAEYLSESPAAGSVAFRKKGCVNCHQVNGVGASTGSDLARYGSAEHSLPQLVTAMWNHAPRMWEQMQDQHLPYPKMENREIAQIFTYIYMSRHVALPGDPAVGHKLFEEKGCVHCHAVAGAGGTVGPDLARIPEAVSAMQWMSALWNHVSAMQSKMKEMGVAWPKFTGQDIDNIYAYVRENASSATIVHDPDPDPESGWTLFQSKGCMSCHGIKDEGGRVGSGLGPNHDLPATFSKLGELMVTAAPAMTEQMRNEGMQPPHLTAQDMTDIFAFLYSLRYLEPSGSAAVGQSVFSWRGCDRCHGSSAQGNSRGPALRGRGEHYTSMGLASSFWRHGAKMYDRTEGQRTERASLLESDVGDLIAFLNSPVQPGKASR
jgi:cytochrome c551/c552